METYPARLEHQILTVDQVVYVLRRMSQSISGDEPSGTMTVEVLAESFESYGPTDLRRLLEHWFAIRIATGTWTTATDPWYGKSLEELAAAIVSAQPTVPVILDPKLDSPAELAQQVFSALRQSLIDRDAKLRPVDIDPTTPSIEFVSSAPLVVEVVKLAGPASVELRPVEARPDRMNCAMRFIACFASFAGLLWVAASALFGKPWPQHDGFPFATLCGVNLFAVTLATIAATRERRGVAFAGYETFFDLTRELAQRIATMPASERLLVPCLPRDSWHPR